MFRRFRIEIFGCIAQKPMRRNPFNTYLMLRYDYFYYDLSAECVWCGVCL